MDRLAYLRGDTAREGGPDGFRQRGGALGDMIHSKPLFIGVLGLPDAVRAERGPPAVYAAGPERRRILHGPGPHDVQLRHHRTDVLYPAAGGYVGTPAILVDGVTEVQFISETAGTVE